MDSTKYAGIITSVLLVLASACSGTDGGTSGVIEYRADDLAWETGDSYTERYLLSVDDGTYERYIGGTYQGKGLSGAFWGTLFETGMYEECSQRIAFSPKKQYDFETKQLVNLGISSQLPYFGMVTSETMTVTWYIIYGYVNVTYKRK